MVNSLHTPENRNKIIETQQDHAGPISDEARKHNAVTVEMLLEEVKAWHLAQAIPNTIVDGFNNVANMTPEMEQAMNELIEKGG